MLIPLPEYRSSHPQTGKFTGKLSKSTGGRYRLSPDHCAEVSTCMVDLQTAYEIFGNNIIRCCNINPVIVMDKTPPEVLKACEEIVQKEKRRKFILSAGCEICVDTALKNLQAMRKASLKYHK